jgi:hypothetical protein
MMIPLAPMGPFAAPAGFSFPAMAKSPSKEISRICCQQWSLCFPARAQYMLAVQDIADQL